MFDTKYVHGHFPTILAKAAYSILPDMTLCKLSHSISILIVALVPTMVGELAEYVRESLFVQENLIVKVISLHLIWNDDTVYIFHMHHIIENHGISLMSW